MITYDEHYATRADAEAAEQEALYLWHPCGYGTITTIRSHDGIFTLTVTRSRSC